MVPGRRLCSLKAASGELRSKLSSVAREKRKRLVSGRIKGDGAQGKVGSPAPRRCGAPHASDSGRSSPVRFSITDTMAAAKFTPGDVLFNMLSLISLQYKRVANPALFHSGVSAMAVLWVVKKTKKKKTFQGPKKEKKAMRLLGERCATCRDSLASASNSCCMCFGIAAFKTESDTPDGISPKSVRFMSLIDLGNSLQQRFSESRLGFRSRPIGVSLRTPPTCYIRNAEVWCDGGYVCVPTMSFLSIKHLFCEIWQFFLRSQL